MEIIKTNLNFGTLTKRQSTKRAFFHHAAMNGSVEDINRVHKGNGWSGIGYHFYIRKDGKIYEGRPIDMIGAHASGANYNSVGVCFEGNFDNEQMTSAQIEAGKWIVAYLKNKYSGITFHKHKEVSATACPGKNFKFDEIVTGKVTETPKTETTVIETVPNVAGKTDIVKNGQIHTNNFCGAGIKTDGVRGKNTMKAGIMVLQTAINLDYKKNLKVDGACGTNTKTTLTGHYVKNGETQYMVTALQILLMLKGYACELQCPGKFDANLEKIVKQYQKDYQLTVDGVAGYNTFMSLIH